MEAIFNHGNVDLNRERALSEQCKRRLLEIELGRKSGQILPFDRTVKVVQDVGHAIKTKLMAIPTSVAAELSAMSDPNEVELFLQGRIEEALKEIAEFDPQVFVPSESETDGSEKYEDGTHG
jgi:hypothetical protein